MSITIEAIISELKARRGGDIPPDSAKFQVIMTRLIATGKPVSAQQLATATGFPLPDIENAFEQMRKGNAEFNEDGNLVGSALTQRPTVHRFRVNGIQLYAWCALDTLFLPAYLNSRAEIESTCPITDAKISLIVNPANIHHCSPSTTVLSIIVPSLVTECNLRSNFCGQIFFFRDYHAALRYQQDHTGVAIFSAADAYRIAQEVYINPVLRHTR